MREDDPVAFGHLVDWLFRRSLRSSISQLDLCKTYVLADKLGVEALTREAYKLLQYKICDLLEIISRDTVKFVWQITVEKLQKSLVEWAKIQLFDPNKKKDVGAWVGGTQSNADFNAYVAVEIRSHLLQDSDLCRSSNCCGHYYGPPHL